MQIVFQVLIIIISGLTYLQKEKWKMMVFVTINNLVCILMYISFSRYSAMALSIIAFVRTSLYAFYAFKNLKPNIYVLIGIEIGFLVAGITLWQDWLDIIPLIAMLEIGYASWQDNIIIFRVGYLINATLYVTYNIIIGAYIASVSPMLTFVTNGVSLIYYNLLKKEKPLVNILKFNHIEKKSAEQEQNKNIEQPKDNIES